MVRRSGQPRVLQSLFLLDALLQVPAAARRQGTRPEADADRAREIREEAAEIKRAAAGAAQFEATCAQLTPAARWVLWFPY